VAAYIATDAPAIWPVPPSDCINVTNGLLTLDPPTLAPHRPDFLSSVQLPLIYEKGAVCPAWERQIQEMMPEDTQDLVWELLAWLLSPELSIQKAVLLLGEGNNGKSRLLRAISAFLGEPNVTAVSLQRLESDRFSAARLVGKLADISPDLPSEHLIGTSTFKAITGHDRMQAEYKYKEAFDFLPYCKLLFSANRPPQSNDATYAFFRRWVVVPFEQNFEGRALASHIIDARLSNPQELSGALNKALAALPGLRRRGDFTESPSMRAAWTEFRQTTDPFAVWLDRATIAKPDALVVKDTLFKAFRVACIQGGLTPPSEKSFGADLRRLRPAIKEGRRTVGGQYVWCWLGIGLSSDPAVGVTRVHNVNHVKDAAICNEEAEEEEGVRGERGIGPMVDIVDIHDSEKHCRTCGMKLSVVAEGDLCGRCQ